MHKASRAEDDPEVLERFERIRERDPNENYICERFEQFKQIVGDHIIYGPPEGENTLSFTLDHSYCGMVWRSQNQRQSRKSLAKGHSPGLDEHGDPNEQMKQLLKLSAKCLEQKLSTEKDRVIRSRLSLALKFQLRIDKRSEKLLAGINYLCAALHRPPAQGELRTHLKMSRTAFPEALRDTGFSWLPVCKRGRKIGS